ncbi:MAG: divalent-cation tolerance protein CutA [Dokdonella sp.]|uniref:divalent-cation tolerance protein CutA n=1 Tax=Dokdonella sp. TaxID=2291710 RepID=UPI0025BA3009|nr:divalent-cation tolerance protein CutA [Dokdonella sp.]MBX3701044.1 divalent-cation tolerance protein CutA [Dokdonella sp.]
MSALLVHCTCPDAASARHIAEVLVAEKLAACVQVLPEMLSIYRWHGEVQHDREHLLLIKTAADHWPALAARIPQLHPYDTPELLAFAAVDGSAGYLAWLADQVQER